ncbi:MAG: ATP-binding cassette domain-containing protein [Alphaproteobacteria bacterium]
MHNVSFSFGKKNILNQLNFDMAQGDFTVLLGRNGSGKSTMLKCFSGALPIQDGQITYHDKNITQSSKFALAKQRTVLSQSISVTFPFSVINIVQLGLFNNPLSEQKKQTIALSYLQMVGLEEYQDEFIQNLSGGQQQRVHIARILCQLHGEKNRIIFVDEPTTALDISYQLSMLNLLKKYQKQANHSIFAILHDVNLALLFADKVAILDKGKIIHHGDNNAYEIKPILEDIYRIPLNILQDGEQYHIGLKV